MEYLGKAPILSCGSIVVSLPSTTQIGSQLYHLDFTDDRQLKLFVYDLKKRLDLDDVQTMALTL